MENQWKQTVKGIIYAIILYSVANILSSAFGSLADTDSATDPLIADGSAIWRTLGVIFALASLGGFIWFFMELTKFISLQANDTDKATITRLRTAYIISVAGVLLDLIPGIGWILSLACSVVSAVMLILAFSDYSHSTALSPEGLRGAAQLRTSYILSFVGSLLLIIPLIGWLASFICAIAAIVLLFKGWTSIADGSPE